MLVLTRKIGEEIVVGENIRIFVVAVEGNRVRLGVEAPKTVPVARPPLGADPRELIRPG